MTPADRRRFWHYLDFGRPDECWPWRGTVGTDNYGLFYDTDVGMKKQVRATRVMLEMITGNDGAGLVACHSCDNPVCVNPAHLWWGTQSDNILDAVKKGRWPKSRDAKYKRGHIVGAAA